MYPKAIMIVNCVSKTNAYIDIYIHIQLIAYIYIRKYMYKYIYIYKCYPPPITIKWLKATVTTFKYTDF